MESAGEDQQPVAQALFCVAFGKRTSADVTVTDEKNRFCTVHCGENSLSAPGPRGWETSGAVPGERARLLPEKLENVSDLGQSGGRVVKSQTVESFAQCNDIQQLACQPGEWNGGTAPVP